MSGDVPVSTGLDLDAIMARSDAARAMGDRFLAEDYIPDEQVNGYDCTVERLAREDVPAIVAALRRVLAVCDEQDKATARVTGGMHHAVWTGRVRAAIEAVPEVSEQRWKPGDRCAACGSHDTSYDHDTGAHCGTCGRSDSDE